MYKFYVFHWKINWKVAKKSYKTFIIWFVLQTLFYWKSVERYTMKKGMKKIYVNAAIIWFARKFSIELGKLYSRCYVYVWINRHKPKWHKLGVFFVCVVTDFGHKRHKDAIKTKTHTEGTFQKKSFFLSTSLTSD